MVNLLGYVIVCNMTLKTISKLTTPVLRGQTGRLVDGTSCSLEREAWHEALTEGTKRSQSYEVLQRLLERLLITPTSMVARILLYAR